MPAAFTKPATWTPLPSGGWELIRGKLSAVATRVKGGVAVTAGGVTLTHLTRKPSLDHLDALAVRLGAL